MITVFMWIGGIWVLLGLLNCAMTYIATIGMIKSIDKALSSTYPDDPDLEEMRAFLERRFTLKGFALIFLDSIAEGAISVFIKTWLLAKWCLFGKKDEVIHTTAEIYKTEDDMLS